MITRLHISIKEIAEGTGYDISYISRIKSGSRRPARPSKLVKDLSNYIAHKASDREGREKIAELLDARVSDINSESKMAERLYVWLFSGDNSPRRYVENFIYRLDAFNLDNYLRDNQEGDYSASVVDEELNIKGGEVSYSLESVTRFARKIVDEREPFTLYWDITDDILPLEMIQRSIAYAMDDDYMVRIIHADDSPTNEMMNWLEKWMPLYMTGQVEPYYIDGGASNISRNSILCSNNAVMTVDTVANNPDFGRVYLTRNPEEIDFYNRKLAKVLDGSDKLMEIIRKENREDRKNFMRLASDAVGTRKSLLSTPPIYTISDSLLDKILIRNNISEEDRIKIKEYINAEKQRIEISLKHSDLEDHIPDISADKYSQSPVFLSLSGLFYDKDIFYTYEEYVEHMNLTRQWEKKHKNYSLVLRKDVGFRNIQIFIHKDKWVMISKNKSPAIHFVIKHERIREALEQMLDISITT
ncbi:MAG: helix-turn-helix transcriptional regulator [Eubacterium sp.]|nr:helix-turn-helix transcriptional regulator [Eubacterium sp.]